MEGNFDFLTERQKESYSRRQAGMTYTAIAAELGITPNAVRTHCVNAERRIREYQQYQKVIERDSVPVDLVLNRGELELIIEGLDKLVLSYEIQVQRNIKTDWRGRLPYIYHVVTKLNERAKQALADSYKSESSY